MKDEINILSKVESIWFVTLMDVEVNILTG